MPLESVKMKNSKIGLRHVLSWPKLGLEPKFHDPGTFGGFGKRGQTNRQTRFMFYKYRYNGGFVFLYKPNNQLSKWCIYILYH